MIAAIINSLGFLFFSINMLDLTGVQSVKSFTLTSGLLVYLELLMEHLQEIRILRQRLEHSIKTNERLRKHLERQVTDKELDQGKSLFPDKLNPPSLL